MFFKAPCYLFLKVLGFFWRIFKRYILFFFGVGFGFLTVFSGYKSIEYTSTDEFCTICHIHPHVTYSWKKSTHYKNESGVVTHCVECHLPSGSLYYFTEKARLGIKDVYGAIFKDTEKIDWDLKSTLEHAVNYTYDSSCLRCHNDLYSLGLSPKGVEAHEYYMEKVPQIKCINCHITVGHFHEIPVEEVDYLTVEKIETPSYPPETGEFTNYTETITGTDVTFNMISITGGTFVMGSPESESYRGSDELYELEVTLSPFWMGEAEVSWGEFDVFYSQTSDTGKDEAGKTDVTDKGVIDIRTASFEIPSGVDAITGPTPPYGSPDQSWGKGSRPAITMTHHAAVRYCEWLSLVTGKKYRLPTEAEWEYACRAGTTEAYFFEGDPEKLTGKSWINRLFGVDESIINKYVWYTGNSPGKTQPPYTNEPNRWGLYNMPGNVKEFCLDWYTPDLSIVYPDDSAVVDPKGPKSGSEHVVRGGSYNSDPADLRSGARDRTYTDRWLLTDPQSPKSKWWYSDSKDVGFRVVREYEEVEY